VLKITQITPKSDEIRGSEGKYFEFLKRGTTSELVKLNKLLKIAGIHVKKSDLENLNIFQRADEEVRWFLD